MEGEVSGSIDIFSTEYSIEEVLVDDLSNVQVKLKNKRGGEKVDKLIYTFYSSDGKVKTVERTKTDNNADLPKEFETKTFTFPSGELGFSLTSSINKVTVTPISENRAGIEVSDSGEGKKLIDNFFDISYVYKIGEQEAKTIVVNVNQLSGTTLSSVKIILEDNNGLTYEEQITSSDFGTNKQINYGNSIEIVNKISIADESNNKLHEITLSAKDYSSTNLIDPSTWVVGTSGSQPGFNRNGDVIENNIIEEFGPFGYRVLIWEGVNKDGDCASGCGSRGDGGWGAHILQ